MFTQTRGAAVIVSMLLLAACASSSTISKSDGISFQVRDRSYSAVWSAAILTVASAGAIESQNRQRGEVRGHRGAGAWSWGEALGVFIEPADETAQNFTVTVVSEHIVQTQLTGQDFRSTMIATMKAQLGI